MDSDEDGEEIGELEHEEDVDIDVPSIDDVLQDTSATANTTDISLSRKEETTTFSSSLTPPVSDYPIVQPKTQENEVSSASTSSPTPIPATSSAPPSSSTSASSSSASTIGSTPPQTRELIYVPSDAEDVFVSSLLFDKTKGMPKPTGGQSPKEDGNKWSPVRKQVFFQIHNKRLEYNSTVCAGCGNNFKKPCKLPISISFYLHLPPSCSCSGPCSSSYYYSSSFLDFLPLHCFSRKTLL